MKKFLLGVVFVLLLLTSRASARVLETPAVDGVGVQVSCLTTTTVIDAADVLRVSMLVQTEDTTNFVHVCLTTTCTAITGTKLLAGSASSTPFIFTEFNEYQGPISCIADTGTVIVNYVELKR